MSSTAEVDISDENVKTLSSKSARSKVKSRSGNRPAAMRLKSKQYEKNIDKRGQVNKDKKVCGFVDILLTRTRSTVGERVSAIAHFRKKQRVTSVLFCLDSSCSLWLAQVSDVFDRLCLCLIVFAAIVQIVQNAQSGGF